LRDIGATIGSADRWRPVFDRYLDVLRSRLVSLGGDPAKLAPPAGGGTENICEPKCTVLPHLGEGVFLGIPWAECEIEGEVDIKLRFKKKCD